MAGNFSGQAPQQQQPLGRPLAARSAAEAQKRAEVMKQFQAPSLMDILTGAFKPAPKTPPVKARPRAKRQAKASPPQEPKQQRGIADTLKNLQAQGFKFGG